MYPSTSTNSQVYPAQSPTQAADRPQLVRFTNVDQILVQAASTEEISVAIREISELLHERHHIRAGQPDYFNIRDMTEMTKALSSTSTLMSGLLLCGLDLARRGWSGHH